MLNMRPRCGKTSDHCGTGCQPIWGACADTPRGRG